MKRCASPAHPHCTAWVMPEAPACMHGHPQPADAGPAPEPAADPIDAIDAIDAADDARNTAAPLAGGVPALAHALHPPPAIQPPLPIWPVPAQHPAPVRPYLHVSGFDPRAAGGRQAIKLALHGMAADAPARLDVLLASDLLTGAGARHAFTRGVHGDWLPVYVEFSSRGREHGQYRIDVELRAQPALEPVHKSAHEPAHESVHEPAHESAHGSAPRAAADGATPAARAWVATLVLLVPRADASLGEIHRTFLSTHKNVRISADDASIARLHGLDAGGSMDIEITARNAGIAQLDLAAPGARGHGGGKIDLGLATIAWDEELIEIDLARTAPAGTVLPLAGLPAGGAAAATHPCPASRACLVAADPHAGAPRHLRLFALDECVLGRWDGQGGAADLALLHYGAHGPDAHGLTRRLSARHALLRARRGGFEIEDVSRYGLLLDGAWPGKRQAMALRVGMRIEFTASVRGVALLEVSALAAHGVLLRRADDGAHDECFLLLAPHHHPGAAGAAAGAAQAPPWQALAAVPPLFHRDGGFWHLDRASGRATPLTPAGVPGGMSGLSGLEGYADFAATARPEDGRAA